MCVQLFGIYLEIFLSYQILLWLSIEDCEMDEMCSTHVGIRNPYKMVFGKLYSKSTFGTRRRRCEVYVNSDSK
jgi:hypothetical protein